MAAPSSCIRTWSGLSALPTSDTVTWRTSVTSPVPSSTSASMAVQLNSKKAGAPASGWSGSASLRISPLPVSSPPSRPRPRVSTSRTDSSRSGRWTTPRSTDLRLVQAVKAGGHRRELGLDRAARLQHRVAHQDGGPAGRGLLVVRDDRRVAHHHRDPVGSGRTDAGVHALAQVAAVTLSNPIPLPNLRKAVNRQLPPAIRVLTAEETPLDFHPRYHATSKTYEYRIFRGEVCLPVEWRYVQHYAYPLDVDRMAALAPILEGEHDFAAFAAADNREMESTTRTIFSSRLEIERDRLFYRVSGSGFLKHMVRNIVGTLLEAGRGNLDEPALREFLIPAAARHAPSTAPAKGLFLVRVEYPVGVSWIQGFEGTLPLPPIRAFSLDNGFHLPNRPITHTRCLLSRDFVPRPLKGVTSKSREMHGIRAR